MKKRTKRIIWTLVLIPVVLAIVVAFATAPIGRKYVNEHGEELIGRKVYIDGFRLNILTGDVSLDDVKIYEKNGKDVFASVDDIDLDISMTDLLTGKLHVEDLDIDHPVVNVVQKDTTFNFDDMLAFMAGDESEASEYTIDDLTLDNGEINYLDKTVPSVPFAYSIKDVEVEVKNFNTADNNHIEVNGELGKDGTFEATYDGKLADQNNMTLTLKLEEVDLKGFSPLFIHMFGREVLSGTLDLQSEITTVNGNINGKNHIVISDPKVEKVKNLSFKPEYRRVPLKNALYVMTDKNGKCEMDLDVKGRKDDPKFSYKRAVMKMFGKFVVKLVTSPFSKHRVEEEE